MNKHFARFKELLIDRPLEEIENTLDHEGAAQAFKKAAPRLAVGLGAVVLVLALLYAARRTIWNVVVIVVMAGVLWASYLENRKSAVGPATTKAPTMEQYITVGNIVKIAAKRVVPMLGLSQIFEESDIKAAKDERIVPCGKFWFLKYRLLKKNVSTVADESMIQRVLQSELRTVLDNDNPAGFDTVRFVYGGIDECVLQVDHVTQGSLYVYIYVCYASADYFSQREQEQENGAHDTADTSDIDF